jgi:hypothetical protein
MRLGDLFNEVQELLDVVVDSHNLPTTAQLVEAATVVAEKHNMRDTAVFIRVCESEIPTFHEFNC